MALVGSSWWKCAYAARGGNWPLAAYFARRVRSLQRKLAVLRPKHRERLTAFETDQLVPLVRAIEATDLAAFEAAFAAATASANRSHVETGYAYIRWVLPDEPPADLDLRDQRERGPGGSAEDSSGANSDAITRPMANTAAKAAMIDNSQLSRKKSPITGISRISGCALAANT